MLFQMKTLGIPSNQFDFPASFTGISMDDVVVAWVSSFVSPARQNKHSNHGVPASATKLGLSLAHQCLAQNQDLRKSVGPWIHPPPLILGHSHALHHLLHHYCPTKRHCKVTYISLSLFSLLSSTLYLNPALSQPTSHAPRENLESHWSFWQRSWSISPVAAGTNSASLSEAPRFPQGWSWRSWRWGWQLKNPKS